MPINFPLFDRVHLLGDSAMRPIAASIESFINSDKYRITGRPEPVEGLRQAQPERFGVMIYENINK